MAIAVDATSSGWQNAVTTYNPPHNHTISGSDTVLLVGYYIFNGTGVFTGTESTYNGTTMTSRGSVTSDGTGGKTALYGLVNPDAGTHAIQATFTANMQIFGTAVSYTGVNQSTPFPDAAIATSTSGTSFSISTTSVTVDQSWVMMVGRSPSRVPTASAGTTVRKTNATSGDAAWLLDSNGGRSTGANTLDYTYSPSATTYYVITNVAPATASGPTNLKSLDTNLKANIKSYNTNLIANVKSINTNA